MSRFVDNFLRKAQLHKQAGEIAEAEEVYKYILSRFPKNRKAIQEYQKLQTPPQPKIDRLIGLFHSGRLKETTVFGEALCVQFPKAPILYEILGAAHLKLRNVEKTLKNYQKLLNLNPKHAER